MRSVVAVLLLATVCTWSADDGIPVVGQRYVAVTNVCAWPNLTLLPDGTVAAVFFNQPSHGQQEGDVECWASVDGAKWKKRARITRHQPNTVRMNHAAGLANDGDFIVLCSGWTNEKQPQRPKQAAFRDGIVDVWIMRSKDGGRTWKKREGFPKAEDGWTPYIPFGDIWNVDGVLHTSCYQGQLREPTQSYRTKGWRSWHFRSDDDGKTWERGAIIGPRHNETDIFPLANGQWLAAARIDKMELIRSTDNGASWSQAVPVTIRNEINGHLTRLKDGRLLLSYGVRVPNRRGVCAKLSSDEGKTWGKPVRLADSVKNADCGYPSSVQLKNGNIVTAWYSKHSTEHEGYHMGVTIWRSEDSETTR